MGVVTFFITTVDNFLSDAAQSQFMAVAATIGTIGTVACTLVVLFVFINMAFGFRSIDGRMAFWLVVKMVLISIFAQSWAQFDAFSSAILNGIDSIAGSLVASVGGGTTGPSGTFAEEFDELLSTMSDYLNAISNNLNWMQGAVINGIGVFLLSLLGGIAAFIIVFSRVLITLMIALAPIMIFLTLFEATKDYFQRWLSASVSFALYPVVVAGIFATIIGVGNSLISRIGDPQSHENLGALIPFFMLVMMSKAFILSTPFIVRSISGNMLMPAMQAVSARGAGAFASGLTNSLGSEQRGRVGSRSAAEWAGVGVRQAATSAGQQASRMYERTQRLLKR